MKTPLAPAAAGALLAGFACLCPAQTHTDGYAPLAFLVGHCWQGTFPGGTVTDRHCFSWVYGDKFVRDQHVLHAGGGKPDALGETLYVWDAASGELQYLYLESGGGFARGTLRSEGDALVFPASTYTEGSERQTLRSRWQRSGAEGYEVNTEFLQQGHWVKGFSLHMQRVPQNP